MAFMYTYVNRQLFRPLLKGAYWYVCTSISSVGFEATPDSLVGYPKREGVAYLML